MQYEENIELQSPIEDAWALEEPEPTNLIAAWPHQDPPAINDIVSAMQQFLGQPVKVLDELETDAPEIQWTVAVSAPYSSRPHHPLMIWLEPAREGADHPPAAAGCPWVIGIETMLDVDDPLTSYHALVRLAAGALPGVPAILDINTLVWRDRHELQRAFLADTEIEPAPDCLWTIQAVQQQEGANAGQPLTWLHTHGLWRCGLPELEMVEVPRADVSAAAMLLNDIAELLLEQGPSQPHEVYEIGANLAVTFQPWQAVAPYIAQDVPGGAADREGMHNRAHAGVRAVVCGVEPAGTYRKLWRWPEQVIRKLQSGDAALFMTQRASRRQALLAKQSLPAFHKAFTAANSEPIEASFLIKAVVEFSQQQQTHREHLWFDLKSFDGKLARATLLNEPIGDHSMARGETVELKCEQITDWQVQTPNGTFGPEHAAQLLEAVSC